MSKEEVMYKVKPLDQQTDKSTDKLIPKHPFSLLINSSKGAGKSTLLMNMLMFYKGLFHRIILFSPTVFLDEKWQDFISKTKLLKVKKQRTNYFGQIDATQKEDEYIHEIYTEYSNKVISDLRKIQEETKPRKDVLVIFEDSLGLNGVFKQSSLIHKYLPNSRHLKTSFIFVSQNYKSIPRLLRNNNSGLILFQTPNDRELMMVYEENSAFLSKDDWMKLYNYIMQGPYNFMYINYQNKKGRQICLNFEKILQIKNIDEE